MKNNEKKPLKKRIKVLLTVLAALVAAAIIWGFIVEPLVLTVSNIDFTDARLPQEMDGIRIVFISDVHVSPDYPPAEVERLTATIAQQNPDMVIFGGDLLQHEDSAVRLDRERVAKAFAALHPRLGKFAIYGNHDIWTLQMKMIAEEILTDGGFTILENSAVEVMPGFYVAGTAPWPMEGENSPKNHSDVSRVAWTTENNAFSLLLAHEPAQIRKDAEYPFALQLSGHTHGGQVALPFTGPILLPHGTEIYKAGFYKLKDLKMYVSRGVGTSIIRLRLFVPPEIVVLTLHCK